QRAVAPRGCAVAADVGPGDVARVALALGAGVDQQRAVAGDALAGVRDVVQRGGVASDRDDALVGRPQIVLLRRRQVREVDLELRRRAGLEQLGRLLVAAGAAPARLREALDLVGRLPGAQQIDLR